MSNPTPASKDQPAPFTMDDIARKFLSTAPTPKPQAKPAPQKAKAPTKK
jgi:hypothetical protein